MKWVNGSQDLIWNVCSPPSYSAQPGLSLLPLSTPRIGYHAMARTLYDSSPSQPKSSNPKVTPIQSPGPKMWPALDANNHKLPL